LGGQLENDVQTWEQLCFNISATETEGGGFHAVKVKPKEAAKKKTAL